MQSPSPYDTALTYAHSRDDLAAVAVGQAILDDDHLYWEHRTDGWYCHGPWERHHDAVTGPHSPAAPALPAVVLPPKEPTP